MKPYFYPDLTKKQVFDGGYIAKHSGHSKGSTIDMTLLHKINGTDVDFLMYERVLYHHMLHFVRWLHFLSEGCYRKLAHFVVKSRGMGEGDGGDAAEVRQWLMVV